MTNWWKLIKLRIWAVISLCYFIVCQQASSFIYRSNQSRPVIVLLCSIVYRINFGCGVWNFTQNLIFLCAHWRALGACASLFVIYYHTAITAAHIPTRCMLTHIIASAASLLIREKKPRRMHIPPISTAISKEWINARAREKRIFIHNNPSLTQRRPALIKIHARTHCSREPKRGRPSEVTLARNRERPRDLGTEHPSGEPISTPETWAAANVCSGPKTALCVHARAQTHT
jgi:hypothetical protein